MQLDSDELNCVTKKQPHIAHQSVYLFISFSPIEISVTYFSAPIGTSVLKFCVHTKTHFAFFSFFFNFSFCHSYMIHYNNKKNIFSAKDFSATT